MAELKKLQKKLGDSLEWILEALSEEGENEPTILRKRQALESLAYAKDVLKGTALLTDDARLFDGRALKTQENVEGSSLETTQAPHVSGYPPLSGSPSGTWPEMQQTLNPECRRGLGHSSSSPSLSNPSVRLSPVLPRAPWNPTSDKVATVDSPAESGTPPKPTQTSSSPASRHGSAETSAAKLPVHHDPLGVL
jgi:TBC1 domain family protein 5